MKKFKRALAILLVLVLSLSMVACGNGGGTEGKDPVATVDPDQPLSFSMQLAYWDAEAPDGTASVVAGIFDQLNATPEITWVAQGAYKDKTTTTLLGDIPDVMYINNTELRSQAVIDVMTNGYFYDLTEYFAKYPNLSKITDGVKTTYIYDGKVMGIPRQTTERIGGLNIRQDWLDALDMEMPHTKEEYTAMFEAFKTKDLDGNGKDDSIACAIFNGVYIKPLMLAAGCPMDWYWDESKGQVLPSHGNENFLAYCDWMKEMYEAGYFPTDFGAMKMPQGKALVNEGNAGSIPDTIGNVATGNVYEPLKNLVAGASLVGSTYQTTPDGKKVAEASPGASGMYAINKKTVSEAELDAILTYFDNMMAEDIMNQIAFGIEGTHYNMENGTAVMIEGNTYAKDALGTNSITPGSTMMAKIKYGTDPNKDQYIEFFESTEIYNYPTLTYALAECLQLMPVKTTVQEAAKAYVTGEKTRADLEKTIQDWYKGGGDAAIKDYTGQYKALMGIK